MCVPVPTKLTWMFILKLGQIVDILVYNDPEAVCLIMRRNVALRKSLRHDVWDKGRWEEQRHYSAD